MLTLGFHLRFRLSNYGVLVKDIAGARILGRAVVEHARPFGLLSFGAADNHLHVVLACQREEAGIFARRLANSLRRRLRLPVPFERCYFEPMLRQGHRYDAFHYALRQQAKHGAWFDPCCESTNLLDLLDMRQIGAYSRTNVRGLLRRVDRDSLLSHFGLEALQPAFHVEHLVEACCSAAGVVDQHGRSPEIMLARRAVAQLGRQELSTARLAELLRCSPSSVRRLRSQPLPGWMGPAVLLQMQLRQELASRRPGEQDGDEVLTGLTVAGR